MIVPINNMRRADNAKNGIKLDIRFIERKGASKSLDMRRVCEKMQKLLVRVETEEWVYEAFELS